MNMDISDRAHPGSQQYQPGADFREALAKSRLNYDLGDYREALLHLTHANDSDATKAEVREMHYLTFKSYYMAPNKVRDAFRDKVKPPSLEGRVLEAHPGLVRLVDYFGRIGVRLHDFIWKLRH